MRIAAPATIPPTADPTPIPIAAGFVIYAPFVELREVEVFVGLGEVEIFAPLDCELERVEEPGELGALGADG